MRSHPPAPTTREHRVNLLYALLIIPILGFLILIHEVGHYWAARRAGIRVEEFGIGLPPRIWGKQRGETLWSINAIPMGGFVRVLGEDGKSVSDESLQSKSVGQRTLFITGGVIMNFITAFLLIGILVTFQGDSRTNVYVTEVLPDSPAATAGWLPGDRFVSIDGETIDEGEDVTALTRKHQGEPVEVVMERGNQEIVTTVTPRVDPPPDQGRTGIRLSEAPLANINVEEVPGDTAAALAGLQQGDRIAGVNGVVVEDFLSYALPVRAAAGSTVDLTIIRNGQEMAVAASVPATVPESGDPLSADLLSDVKFWRVPWYQIPRETVSQFFHTIRLMFDGLVSLVRGETPLSDVAGPIGMGQLTSEVIQESSLPVWVTVTNIAFFLSLNLAILNLLPLPALDGGRLVFVILEVMRRGKRIAPEKEGMVHFVGLVVLLTLMFVIAFLDIDRLISGNSLIE